MAGAYLLLEDGTRFDGDAAGAAHIDPSKREPSSSSR